MVHPTRRFARLERHTLLLDSIRKREPPACARAWGRCGSWSSCV